MQNAKCELETSPLGLLHFGFCILHFALHTISILHYTRQNVTNIFSNRSLTFIDRLSTSIGSPVSATSNISSPS